MASFRVALKTFSRSAGQTATAAVAYRCGTVVHDDRTGLTFNYSRRRGVEHTATLAPADAPAWALDPAKLWNAAEVAEVRTNARIARELLVSLPAELDPDQRVALTHDLARMLVDRYGVAATAAVHAPDRRGDQRNHHAHVLFTTRAVRDAGFGAKVRVLDDRKTGPEEVEALRATAAALINDHLERAGLAARVDHRTLAEQAKAAEERGDLAAAVLLTREPRRREARADVERRRRGLPVAGDWNDQVNKSNRLVLAGYLRGARAAIRSSRDGGAPPARARGPRLGGPGARALAAQANQTRRRQRQDERGARWFAAMLERTRIQISEQNRRTLLAYCQAYGRTPADVEALAFHGQRDPGCYRVLARALEARALAEDARAGLDAARDRRGAAMVRTTQARQAFERGEAEPPPSRLRWLTRKQWAQKREVQRAALDEARRAERDATEGAGVRMAEERVRLARRSVDEVEAQRRQAYGVPGDETPPERPARDPAAGISQNNHAVAKSPQPAAVPPNPDPRRRPGARPR